MTDLSVVPIKGKVMRITAVDVCGNPITGASGGVITTKGFISLALEPQFEDGEKQRQKLADGTMCVVQDDDDNFNYMQITADLCGVCPSIEQFVAGARLLGTGGPVTGTGAAYAEGNITTRFGLEVWQAVTGRGNCDPATGLPRYVYWAFPNLGNVKKGSSTIENAALKMQFVAKTRAVGPLWGDGPGTLGPWAPTFIDGEHFLWNITTIAPPTIPANCGAVPIS